MCHMAKECEVSGKLEWRINVPDGTTKKLGTETGGLGLGVWSVLINPIRWLMSVIRKFLEKAWSIAVAEPKKVVHGLKVGLALTAVSLFYYMRPLYNGFGGNAMWAVMTVVVVFESTVGATLSKCINRATGTFLAGALGLATQWIATQSGKRFQPIVLGISVFLLASAATFSRFVPSVKARFDYGVLIFVLTFSLISVSGYRVEKLFEMAHQRLSTIAIGTSLCILIGILICPIWAGTELHNLVCRNLEKLADSLDECVAEYFGRDEAENSNEEESPSKKMEGYKCVLNSKATEEPMANFARWEPAHGKFSFRHPWKQYLKVGASMRSCAYCIEALNCCVNSEFQAPDCIKGCLKEACMKLSSHSSNVLKELLITLKLMTKSAKIDFAVAEMNFAVEELKSAVKSLPEHLLKPSLSESGGPDDNKGESNSMTKTATPSLLEVLPLASLVSLLIEVAGRIERIVEEIQELANQADFKPPTDQKPKQKQPTQNLPSHNQDDDTMKALPKV